MKRIQRILQKETEIKRATSLWSAALASLLISAFLLTVFSVEKGNSVYNFVGQEKSLFHF